MYTVFLCLFSTVGVVKNKREKRILGAKSVDYKVFLKPDLTGDLCVVYISCSNFGLTLTLTHTAKMAAEWQDLPTNKWISHQRGNHRVNDITSLIFCRYNIHKLMSVEPAAASQLILFFFTLFSSSQLFIMYILLSGWLNTVKSATSDALQTPLN